MPPPKCIPHTACHSQVKTREAPSQTRRILSHILPEQQKNLVHDLIPANEKQPMQTEPMRETIRICTVRTDQGHRRQLNQDCGRGIGN